MRTVGLENTIESPPADVAVQSFRELIRTMGLAKRVLDPFFSQFGISGPQFAVLRALLRHGGESGLRSCDIGEHLLIRPPSVTGIVERLMRMGLVERRPSRTDRRERRVGLSEKGRALIEQIISKHSQQVQQMLAGLEAEEQARLGQLLSKLGNHLELLAERVESTISFKENEA